MINKFSQTAYEMSDWLNYLTRDEIDGLKQLVEMIQVHRQRVIVNIGAGAGTSAMAFLEADPNCHLTTIDITLESNPRGCLAGETEALTQAGYLPREDYQQIHGDSKGVGKYWKIRNNLKPDIVFVDGDHSEAGARGDIEIWMKNINRAASQKGGIIAIHDYKKEEAWMRRNPGKKVTPKIRKQIKAWLMVDKVVDEIFEGQEPIFVIDSLVAYWVNK